MNKRQKTSLQQQNSEVVETDFDDNAVIVENPKELIHELFEKTDSYIKTNVSLLKLKTVDKTGILVSSFSASLVLFSLCFLMVLFISIGAGIWMGQVLNNMTLGFMIVAGFYAVLITIYLLFGKKMIKNAVNNSVISHLTK